MAYSDDQWLSFLLNMENIKDHPEFWDEDLRMIKRSYDAYLSAASFQKRNASKCSGLDVFELVREVLMLDPVYQDWFSAYAGARSFGGAETFVHIQLVAEGIFSDQRLGGSRGERVIAGILNKAGIPYSREHTISGLRHLGMLRFDFYLHDHSAAIEFHGEQHYHPVPFFGGEPGFELTRIRDSVKSYWCADNGVRLIVVPHTADIESFVAASLRKIGVSVGR